MDEINKSDFLKEIKENENNEHYARAVVTQNGRQYEFDVLDSILYNEKQYVLASIPDALENAVIMKGSGDSSAFEILSRGAEYLEVANLFKDKSDFKITEN